MQVSDNEAVYVEEKHSSVTKTSVCDNGCSQAVVQDRKISTGRQAPYACQNSCPVGRRGP